MDVADGPLPHDPRRNAGHDAERGTSCKTTASAPMMLLRLMRIGPRIFAPAPGSHVRLQERVSVGAAGPDPLRPAVPGRDAVEQAAIALNTVSLPITRPNPCTMTIPGPRSAWRAMSPANRL